MQPVPKDLQTKFQDFLLKKSIPLQYHSHYSKWLRFYMDFCQKYNHLKSDRKSLSFFLQKLREKKQKDFQIKQATQAISIYYEIIEPHSQTTQAKPSRKKESPHHKPNPPAKSESKRKLPRHDSKKATSLHSGNSSNLNSGVISESGASFTSPKSIKPTSWISAYNDLNKAKPSRT